MILALLRCLWRFTSMSLFTGRSLGKNIWNLRKYSWNMKYFLSFHQPLNAGGESLINAWLINKWNRFQFDSGTQWSARGVTRWRVDREDGLQSKVHHYRRAVRNGLLLRNASFSRDPFDTGSTIPRIFSKTPGFTISGLSTLSTMARPRRWIKTLHKTSLGPWLWLSRARTVYDNKLQKKTFLTQ